MLAILCQQQSCHRRICPKAQNSLAAQSAPWDEGHGSGGSKVGNLMLMTKKWVKQKTDSMVAVEPAKARRWRRRKAVVMVVRGRVKKKRDEGLEGGRDLFYLNRQISFNQI